MNNKMGFLSKLEKPKEEKKKETKVENPSKTKTKTKEKGETQPKVVVEEKKVTVENREKTLPPSELEPITNEEIKAMETDKTNYGGIGIVGEHVEISKFKALVKFHGKGKVNRSIGRVLVEVLKEYNEKNKM